MHFVLTFLPLFGFWILLSGRFDLFHLSLGVVSTLAVTAFATPLWFPKRPSLGDTLGFTTRFGCYCCWLLWQILLANLHVTRLALHPRPVSTISPKIIRFRTTLKSEFAKVMFANSITLTPGTVTIRVVDDEFTVHAISEQAASELPGTMEKRVAAVFQETT